MSHEATNWALYVPVGGNAKVILLGLANHAHPDGREAYPALDTLADYAACDRSTARRNVRKLEDDGWIEQDGHGPRGELKWRLCMERELPPRRARRGGGSPRGGSVPPVASEPAGGGTGAPEGVAPVPPEPSFNHKNLGTDSSAGEREREPMPEDVPEHLREPTREAAIVLWKVARQRAAKVVTLAAVAQAVISYPDRDHVTVARDLEAWLLHGNGARAQCRDVVARYRNFLRSSDALARHPNEPAPPLPLRDMSAGATGRRMSAADSIDATVQQLRNT